MVLRVLLFIVLLLVIDFYLLINFKHFLGTTLLKNIFKGFYTSSIMVSYIAISVIFVFFNNRPTQSSFGINLLFGYAFAFIILKFVLFLFTAFDDVLRIGEYLFNFLWRLFGRSEIEVTYPSRRKFIGLLGLGIAAIPFVSMLFGVTKGKYLYKVKRITLKFTNLPSEFDGYKICQLSDIHAGSFDSLTDVTRGVKMVNDLQPDVILFTGDFINQDTDELLPFKDVFATLTAKDGKFSVLGNHDYGTHKKWPSIKEKVANLHQLFAFQKEMGFKLLNNETYTLVKNQQKLHIVGVENWGNPPFPQLGDLEKALDKVNKHDFKILMSHDPTHWEAKVLPHSVDFPLTLSGHTHGMQFGVEIPGFKWSPSKYIYKQWAGLYQQNNQYLYVNRGFGFLGFPGRVGIWPEITEITLKKG